MNPLAPMTLPPISSAAAGIPQGPNYGQMLAEAVAKFPGQMQEQAVFQQQQDAAKAQQREARLREQQTKLAMKAGEQKLETETQTNALQKLNLYYRMGVSDTTGSRAGDPEFIKAVSDASKSAGLGPLTIKDPATGAERVDLQALHDLVGSKLLSELSPSEQTAIGQTLPGEPRKAALERYGVPVGSVSPNVLNAPPTSSFGQRADVIEKFGKQLAAMPAGTQTAAGISAQLSLRSSELAAAGVSVSDLRDYFQSPAFVQGTLAPAAQAKMQQLREIGIKDEALAAYYKQKTVDEPKKLAADIEYRNGALSLRAERLALDKSLGSQRLQLRAQELDQKTREIDTHVANLQLNLQKAAHGQGMDLARFQQASLKARLTPLLELRKQLQSEANSYIANTSSHEIPEELVTRIKTVNDRIEKASAVLQDADGIINKGTNTALSRMTGGQASLVPTKLDPKNPPPGAEYSARRKQWRVGGHLFDERGNPVGQ